MKQLTINTTRKISDSDWKTFKEFYQLNGIKLDWKELEKTGKTDMTQHEEGEDVITHYELKEL